jgi:hypothetical protein
MEYEAKHNPQSVPVPVKLSVAEQKQDINGLLEALKYVDAAIAEVDKMKVNLLGIKAQIQKFVK